MGSVVKKKMEATLKALLAMGQTIELRGVEWTLYPLELLDFADLEEWGRQTPNASDIDLVTYLLWLSLRRGDLSQEQVYARNWDLKLSDVGFILPLDRVDSINQVILDLNPALKKSAGASNGLGGGLLPGQSQAASFAPGDPALDPGAAQGPAGALLGGTERQSYGHGEDVLPCSNVPVISSEDSEDMYENREF